MFSFQRLAQSNCAARLIANVVLQITGGVLFLAFGVHALYEGMYDLS